MNTLKAVLLGLFIILVVLFAVQNLPVLTYKQSMKLDLLFTSFQTPEMQVALYLIICFSLGFFTALILGFMEKRRLLKNYKGLQDRLARTEEELNSLRNLPITSDLSPLGPRGFGSSAAE